MKKTSERKPISPRAKAAVLRCAESAVLVLALLFDLIMLGDAFELNEKLLSDAAVASLGETTRLMNYYFGATLITLALHEVLRFFKNRSEGGGGKKDFFFFGYAAILVTASVLSFLPTKETVVSAVMFGLYLCPMLIKRVLDIVGNRKSARKIIFDSMLIFLILIFGLTILSLSLMDSNHLSILFVGALVFVACIVNICGVALSNFNNKVLKKIIRKTYAGEIIFGLMLMIIAFSIVLMRVESSIESFDDALWYCFMLVTTIGFGDITSISVVGRLLSVILGLYGIIVVAILTSIIVNFYNEIKDKKEDGEKEDEEDEKTDKTDKINN